MKSRLHINSSWWVFDILFEVPGHWHPDTFFFLKSAPLFTQVLPNHHRLSSHVCTIFTFSLLCVIVCSCASSVMDLGSWTLPAQGRRVLCRDRRERASRECTHKTRMSTLHQWQMGTIPHANQMCSIIRRLLHEFFILENNDFLRHKFHHMCIRLLFWNMYMSYHA